MPFSTDELGAEAMGGTELCKLGLARHADPALLARFHITVSRYRGPGAPGAVELCWLHDLPDDPESAHLADGGWAKFERIVFVSHWQMQLYLARFGIPWSRAAVMRNAIEPVALPPGGKPRPGPGRPVRVVYSTTPHRGLAILVAAFERMCERPGAPDAELHVFSSFRAYGPAWAHRDAPFEPLFERCRRHPRITYHGYRPNRDVRAALAEAHVHAYPSVWPETSCVSLIEAMSAGCLCVHPNYGALPETAASWTSMYQWTEDPGAHVAALEARLAAAVAEAAGASEASRTRLEAQKAYADLFYGWQGRAREWDELLRGLLAGAPPRA